MTTDSVGGVWTYATDLAAGLVTCGVSTTLVVAGPFPSDAQLARAAEIPNLRVIDSGHDLDWRAENPDAVRLVAQDLSALARHEHADILHLNSPSLAAFARFDMPVLGACHSCLATWWRAAADGPMPEDFVWRTSLLIHGYAACDALVAPSHAFAAQTGDIYGITPAVVYNGRAAEVIFSEGARERCVFTAGRLWDNAKNVTSFDRMASLLDCPAYAAGTLTSGNRLHHASAMGLLDPVAVRQQMSQSLVFVSLASYEPFGLAVLEAAQSGCALVLSDITSFRELWDGAALFVKPTDYEAAASAVHRLLDDSPLAAQLGEAARTKAKLYSVDAMAKGMMALYSLIRCNAGAMA